MIQRARIFKTNAPLKLYCQFGEKEHLPCVRSRIHNGAAE